MDRHCQPRKFNTRERGMVQSFCQNNSTIGSIVPYFIYRQASPHTTGLSRHITCNKRFNLLATAIALPTDTMLNCSGSSISRHITDPNSANEEKVSSPLNTQQRHSCHAVATFIRKLTNKKGSVIDAPFDDPPGVDRVRITRPTGSRGS